MSQFDIVVIGGGMVGQAFALSMADTNLKIAIIEPNNPNPTLNTSFHTRISAITPNSEVFLKKLGVWDLIKRKQPFNKTKVWDQNSHGKLSFSTADDDQLTHLGHIIENDGIQSALFAALSNTQVEWISSKLDSIKKTDSGYQLHIKTSEQLSCGLLVGADGALSRVRELAGIESRETNYQQQAIVCNIRATKDFEDTIWQRFLSNSIIALLPLSENEASVVWSAENGLAETLMQLSNETFSERLSAGVEYRFGRFELLTEMRAFPLVERSAKDYVRANLALIGDAAHNIHPLAGQGVNLGFADVQVLSQQLQASNVSLGDYGTLHAYARARRLDNELMAKTMTGLNWIYKANNEPFRWLRGSGMNFINNNQTLKSFFQKHAIGKL